MSLHDEAAAAFARDGVACVRSVLDPGEVAEAAAAIDAVLARPGPLAQVASAPGDPGAFSEDFRRWQEIPQIERLARHSRVPAVAAALMATPRVRFYHDHVLGQGGRDQAAHTLAPGPALLQPSTAGASAPGSRWTRCPKTGAWNWWRARTAVPG